MHEQERNIVKLLLIAFDYTSAIEIRGERMKKNTYGSI